MDALETLASQWIAEHPEYHADLSDVDAALTRQYSGDNGQSNPFLHLSMHLSISEQCSIDQPQGIRQAVELLAARRDSLHEAHHAAMDCLGTMLWEIRAWATSIRDTALGAYIEAPSSSSISSSPAASVGGAAVN